MVVLNTVLSAAALARDNRSQKNYTHTSCINSIDKAETAKFNSKKHRIGQLQYL